MKESNKTTERIRVWVCSACGKLSWDRIGKHPLGTGWDVSCSINAVHCWHDSLLFGTDGRVVKATAAKEEEYKL